MTKAKQSHKQRLAAMQRRREEERRRARRRRLQRIWGTVGLVVALAAVAAFVVVRVVGGDSEPAAAKGGQQQAAQDARQDAPTAPEQVACGGTVPPRNTDRPTFEQAPQAAVKPGVAYAVTMTTSCGEFTIELAAESAPVNVTSFLQLAREGFYDGTWFHRIVPGGGGSIGVLQGGDPQGSGAGGPGYELPDEPPEGGNPYPKYSVAMANAGPNTAGSQFFINTQDNSRLLEPNYTVIGTVTEGREVIDRIVAEVPVQDETPTQAVWIEKATVVEG